MSEHVILVNECDEAVGTAEKLQAHFDGRLHRALSVFVFNTGGQLLLQKRQEGKYHSAGLYSNTCCSHPRPGEDTEAAAHRRLQEEMGFDCDLQKVFSLLYRVRFDDGLYEYEYDHVFVGVYDGEPIPNPEEVSDWCWVSVEKLACDLAAHPDRYTYWFRLMLGDVVREWAALQSRSVTITLPSLTSAVNEDGIAKIIPHLSG